MKKLIQLKLKIIAKMILTKYRPEVIGITGSVGKTSAKEAIYTVLNKKYRVRRNIKNYNNEIGVPLTIIGQDSPGKSIYGWLRVFIIAAKLLIIKDKEYPEVLVIEMGVDRPGDMKYLQSIVRPKIGVVTMIGPVHLEFFGSIVRIQKEKGELIEKLPLSGWAILNYDNEKTRVLAKRSRAKTLTYGFDEQARIRAQEVIFSFEDHSASSLQFGGQAGKADGELRGISFKLAYNGSFVPVLLPQVIGYHAVYAALAGAAVGIAYGMNLVAIAEALRHFDSPKGRMNLIAGNKHTQIIDDTYNSSPQSVIAALNIMKMIPLPEAGRRLAVLGDMLELGSYSEKGHLEVGKFVTKTKIDKLIVVGERARDIARGAESAGMSRDNIFHFPDAAAAGRFLEDRLQEHDLVLVKGSQGLRLEKIVEEIMAEPLRASELLVRQDEQWLKQ